MLMLWEVRRDIETGLRSGHRGRGGELSYSQHSEDCMNTSRDLPRTDKWRKPVQCDVMLSAVSHMGISQYPEVTVTSLLVTTRRRNKRRESTSKRARGVSSWRRTRGFSTWGRTRRKRVLYMEEDKGARKDLYKVMHVMLYICLQIFC